MRSAINFTIGIDQKLDQILRDLAAKLGITVQELWKAGVQYTYANGIVDLVTSSLLLIAVIAMAYLTYKFAKSKDLEPLSALTGVVGAILCVPLIINFKEGLRAILAPDGVLLIKILELLSRGGK